MFSNHVYFRADFTDASRHQKASGDPLNKQYLALCLQHAVKTLGETDVYLDLQENKSKTSIRVTTSLQVASLARNECRL